jgi:hypothetical protein
MDESVEWMRLLCMTVVYDYYMCDLLVQNWCKIKKWMGETPITELFFAVRKKPPKIGLYYFRWLGISRRKYVQIFSAGF